VGQLRRGGVKTQTLAVYAKTSATSSRKGMQQVKIYSDLQHRYPNIFTSYWDPVPDACLKTLLAFENASSFCSEREPLERGIKRLRRIVASCEKPLYVSLTWKDENRFGGGDITNIGLKEDGKRLLYELQDLSYCVDLSHASDPLAYDILSFCDREKVNIRCIASHSNMRAVHGNTRNLPEEIAVEIVRRGGLIGLNLIVQFLGTSINCFLKHLEWGLERGLGQQLALGADFFADCIISQKLRNRGGRPYFEGYDNAACYKKLYELIDKTFGEKIASNVSFHNANKFFKSLSVTK
jgi:microsomal dipeptidase-like Zn-dependent dipeptidase